ncbi:MAG: hypothetical protein KAU94_11880 [Verrucomicrobia bacterium]|nr:hypothetical protein [Verrucomicrobiota bacterium]
MKKLLILSVLSFLGAGCATLGTDRRMELDHMAVRTLAALERENPGLQGSLEASLGYLVVEQKVVKVPVVGGGRGYGVVVENATGKRTYVRVGRIDFGGGWGVRSFKVLLVFNDPKLLKKAQTGKWVYQMGAEASAGPASIEGSSTQLQNDKGYEIHVLSEGGASATFTLRAIRLKPYRDERF